MKRITQQLFFTFILFLIATVPVAYAQIQSTNTSGGRRSVGSGLENPLRSINSFEDFVELLLEAVIRIGLPIAVLFIVYSGFLFVTAQGSEDKIKKAKDTFFYTVVGVTVFLGSWALALIVKNTIGLLTG